jgi:hypothetical protein
VNARVVAGSIARRKESETGEEYVVFLGYREAVETAVDMLEARVWLCVYYLCSPNAIYSLDSTHYIYIILVKSRIKLCIVDVLC